MAITKPPYLERKATEPNNKHRSMTEAIGQGTQWAAIWKMSSNLKDEQPGSNLHPSGWWARPAAECAARRAAACHPIRILYACNYYEKTIAWKTWPFRRFKHGKPAQSHAALLSTRQIRDSPSKDRNHTTVTWIYKDAKQIIKLIIGTIKYMRIWKVNNQ